MNFNTNVELFKDYIVRTIYELYGLPIPIKMKIFNKQSAKLIPSQANFFTPQMLKSRSRNAKGVVAQYV